MKKVPVWYDNCIIAYALVDNKDYARVIQHVWYRSSLRGHTTIYAQAYIDGRNIYMHDFIVGKPPKGYVVDHVDGVGLHCQRSNLRTITYSDNLVNCKPSGKSQLLGVYYSRIHKLHWRAIIKRNNKYVLRKNFETAKDAAIARDNWYRQSDQAHIARYNFPRIGERGLDGKLRTK